MYIRDIIMTSPFDRTLYMYILTRVIALEKYIWPLGQASSTSSYAYIISLYIILCIIRHL